MSTTRVTVDSDDPSTFPQGRINPVGVDATTETEIALQAQEDEAAALQAMARYTRRVCQRPDLSQAELARRIDVSHKTIRNWEQGKHYPSGAARMMLRLLDKAPETALHVLT